MRGWHAVVGWIRLRAGQPPDDMERELQSHLDLEIEDGRDAGLSREAARRAARRVFGNPALVREAVRDVWTWRWLEDGLADVTYAIRTLRTAPGFALSCVLTLALGIGATTAMFTVLHSVFLRPLPYADSTRLVLVSQELKAGGVKEFPFATGDIGDLRAQDKIFEGVAALQTFKDALAGNGREPEQVRVARVSTNMFSVLGVHVAIGRGFVDADGAPADSTASSPPVMAVVSHEMWERRFSGSPDIAGATLELATGQARVVGVLDPGVALLWPPRAHVETHPDIWLASRADFDNGQRTSAMFRVIGRLKPGVTVEVARRHMDDLAADLRRRFALREAAAVTIDVEPMQAALMSDARPAILAIAGAVVLVFLIACANVANLMLARAARRERELTVRAAIGAARGRLIRQMMAESLILSLAGAAFGLLVAVGAIRTLVAAAPPSLPRLDTLQVDAAALGVAILASVACAVVCGLLPVLRAFLPNLADGLRESGRVGRVGTAHVRHGFVVAEVALSFVLLVGSGLVLRTFILLQRVDPGFDASHILTLYASDNRSVSADEHVAFTRDVRAALMSLPGVEDASAASPLPLDGELANVAWSTEAAASDPNLFRRAAFHSVLPGYFETLRTPLLAGRTFLEADNRPGQRAVVIDALLAARAFGTSTAVGQHLFLRLSGAPESFDVIGVVAHQRHASLLEAGREALFLPESEVGAGASRWIVRTTGGPTEIVAAAKAAIARVAPFVAVGEVQPMQGFVDRAEAPTRLALLVMAAFAGVAMIFASVGLYGILTSSVRERTAEIGVRMAFGAGRSNIFNLVVGEGLRLSAAGIAVGLACALGIARVMPAMVVGVSPQDPLTLLTIVALVLSVAVAACALPAIRASRLDPTSALRQE